MILFIITFTVALILVVVVILTLPTPDKDKYVDINSALAKFLNDAGVDYLRSCETRNTSYFSQYCTRELNDRLVSYIYIDDALPLYSSRGYSKTLWRLCERDGNRMVIEKTTQYRDIKINGSRVKINEDTRELWTLRVAGKNKYLVENIL